MEYAYGHTTTLRHSEKNDKRKVLTYACINVKISYLTNEGWKRKPFKDCISTHKFCSFYL